MFPASHDANKIDTYAERSALICVEYLHPYCKVNILSYYSVNINIGIGQMCFDISVSDRIGYLPYRWITTIDIAHSKWAWPK